MSVLSQTPQKVNVHRILPDTILFSRDIDSAEFVESSVGFVRCLRAVLLSLARVIRFRSLCTTYCNWNSPEKRLLGLSTNSNHPDINFQRLHIIGHVPK